MHLAPSLPSYDRKTRRKLEDQRRMAFRRAIEAHFEQRRLNALLSDFPELLATATRSACERRA